MARAARWTLLMLASVAVYLALCPVAGASVTGDACAQVLGRAAVRAPSSSVAWRVGIERRTALLDRLPGTRWRVSSWIERWQAPWLLVVDRARAADGRCWLRVRLPWRPNGTSAWLNAQYVVIQKTAWRIAISRSRRALTVLRSGKPIRTVQVVVGKPSTPTPSGLFAVWWAIPWHPNDFLGSWVLELTAHSEVLMRFDGGDGTVGIHGRGGASLLDPLGSARSHGCIRLANDSIDWLVHTIGASHLPGVPVQIT